MTLNAFRAAVETAVSGGWTTTPIYYGSDIPHVPETRWVRVNVYPTTSTRITIGTYLDREVGVVRIELFVSQEDGTGLLMSYYDTLSAIFRGQTIGGALFQSPSYRQLGHDSGWLSGIIDCPYYRDTCF